MKRILSAILILITVLSCVTFTVSAEEAVITDEGRLPFEDVSSVHWFHSAVIFCYANKIVNGMNEYTFGGSGNLTRGQFVAMLANLEGVDTDEYTVNKFTDVKSTHWYYGAVNWAYEKGIVSGMTETTFAPNGVLTRAQLATVMKNYMEGKYEVEVRDGVLDKFTDKPKESYWYYDAMKYAVSAELLSGNSDGTLASTGTVTRAQAVVIFKSFMEKYFHGDCDHTFSEATCTTAATCSKCGMANGLPTGHSLSKYDCVTGGKCSVCEAEVSPSRILHQFSSATCTRARVCKRCNAKRGAALGHKYKPATCTEPNICERCNFKMGQPLGHTTSTTVCDRCGKKFYSTDLDKVTKILKAEGQLYKGSYVLVMADADSTTRLSYKSGDEFVTVENTCTYKDGDYGVTTVTIPKYETRCDYTYDYYLVYQNTSYQRFKGYGMFYCDTFTKNDKEGFGKTEGTVNTKYQKYMDAAIHEMLDHINMMLKPYGSSVRDLGFVNYK